MKTLNQYIKQAEQKDIIESFDELYKIALESNRNKEWWDTFKTTKIEALNMDLRGEELEKFIAPLYATLNDDSLKSALTKEQKEANSEIWNNAELKIQREAIKAQLNRRFKDFFIEARKQFCNDEFIEQIANCKFECYKHAFGLKEIDREIQSLRSIMHEAENQLNANQIETQKKFDKLIDGLIKAQEINKITINAYNSGDYGDKDSSLWTQIFSLRKGAIKQNLSQDIIDLIIADCNRNIESTIKRLIYNKELNEAKKQVGAEAREIYINGLNDRQREIHIAFDNIKSQYVGKQNGKFWLEVFTPIKRSAIAFESNDEELKRYFAEIQQKSIDSKYLKNAQYA